MLITNVYIQYYMFYLTSELTINWTKLDDNFLPIFCFLQSTNTSANAHNECIQYHVFYLTSEYTINWTKSDDNFYAFHKNVIEQIWWLWWQNCCVVAVDYILFLIVKFNFLAIVRRWYTVAPKLCWTRLPNFVVYAGSTVLDHR